MALADEAGDDLLARPDRLALHWLERDQQPRLIVDHDRRIVWSNAPAAAVLRRARELQDIGGVLAAHDPADQLRLARFIADCGPQIASLAVPAIDGDGHVLLRGWEIADGGEARYVGLLLLRSGSGYRAEYANLEEAFRLTQKEHQVLLEMVAGNTPDEVAASLGVTVDTARSHIRQIYAKLAVNSREKLFWRVKPYRL